MPRSSPLILCCATERSFDACIPDPADRRVVFGRGEAFVLVGLNDTLEDAAYRAITENGWRARGLIGVTPDGAIVMLHEFRSPDALCMMSAAVSLAKQASERVAGAVQWLDQLASLPDTRESEAAHA